MESVRLILIATGGALAVVLFAAPRLACRLYAASLAKQQDRAAGFWAFLAAGGGSSTRRESSASGRSATR
jgi:hypothetical protein